MIGPPGPSGPPLPHPLSFTSNPRKIIETRAPLLIPASIQFCPIWFCLKRGKSKFVQVRRYLAVIFSSEQGPYSHFPGDSLHVLCLVLSSPALLSLMQIPAPKTLTPGQNQVSSYDQSWGPGCGAHEYLVPNGTCWWQQAPRGPCSSLCTGSLHSSLALTSSSRKDSGKLGLSPNLPKPRRISGAVSISIPHAPFGAHPGAG